jgi:hypothetical protein
MTNILLKSLFKINNHEQVNGQPTTDMTRYFSSYRTMQDLSILSFKRNLRGPWHLVELDGEFDQLSDAFKHVMAKTKEIWKEHYPCNILYTDPDTLCIKPVEIFGKFNEFRLFTNAYPLSRTHYHNCGVRYFPKEIDTTFWESIDKKMSQWDHTLYDQEQNIYTKCMWEQPSLHKNILQPQSHVVTQVTDSNHDAHSNFGPDAAILHFHASRDPASQLTCMQEYWDWIHP